MDESMNERISQISQCVHSFTHSLGIFFKYMNETTISKMNIYKKVSKFIDSLIA